jgi:hypothetical protein
MLGPVVAALALAAPPIQRWYEVDLRAAADGGAPTTGSGLALAELVHELAAQRFDGVLLWLPPPLAADLPPEPHAREFPRAALPPPIAALLGPDLEPSLRVALGAPAPDEADDARRHGSASFHALWIEGPGAPLELARAVRPEVTTLLWCDPEWDRDSDALALSERLVFDATPALRPLQARLDVAAFGGAGLDGARAAAQRAGIEGAAFERLRLQSRLASRIARRLSGATPERCDPLQNTWSGPPPPDLPGALRRAPPWIDLEETRLSPGAFARGESGGGERDTAEFESVASAAAAASGSECAGVLAAGDVAALAQLAAAPPRSTSAAGSCSPTRASSRRCRRGSRAPSPPPRRSTRPSSRRRGRAASPTTAPASTRSSRGACTPSTGSSPSPTGRERRST